MNFAVRITHVFFIHLQLRDTALSYHNCNSSSVFESAFAHLRIINHYKMLLSRCSDGDVKSRQYSSSASDEVPLLMTRQCCQSVGPCDACVFYQPEHPLSVRACEMIQMSYFNTISSGSPGFGFGSCVDSTAHYNTAEFVSRCCIDANHSRSLNWTVADYLEDWRRKAKHRTSLFHDFSADAFVQNEALRRFCKRSQWFVDDIRDFTRNSNAGFHPSADFVGLGCRTNRSVQFYVMDRQSLYGLSFLQSIFGNKLDAMFSSSASDGNTGHSPVAVVDINVSHWLILISNFCCYKRNENETAQLCAKWRMIR